MTNRTPEQILCCPEGCANHEEKCLGMAPRWSHLLAISAADRLTLARALVPDGWVVVKMPPPKKHIHGMDEAACGDVIGWNSCRVTMLTSSEAPNDE